MHPILTVLTSMAAGAAAMYWLDSAVVRRRAGRLLVSESRVRDQVQARIGKLVSHPDAIEVTLDGGVVRVSGHVLAGEIDRLLSQLTHMPGVHKVHNALSVVADESRFEEQRRAATQAEPTAVPS